MCIAGMLRNRSGYVRSGRMVTDWAVLAMHQIAPPPLVAAVAAALSLPLLRVLRCMPTRCDEEKPRPREPCWEKEDDDDDGFLAALKTLSLRCRSWLGAFSTKEDSSRSEAERSSGWLGAQPSPKRPAACACRYHCAVRAMPSSKDTFGLYPTAPHPYHWST